MKVSVDVRGVTKVPRLCKQYLMLHTRIAKSINFQLVSNQQVDSVVWDSQDIPTAFFEIKLDDDLVKSLNNGQLHKEMREYTLLANNYDPPPTIYLLCGGYYEEIIYQRLIGLITEKWGWVKVHMSTSPKKIIEKMFKIIRKPDSDETEFIPTLIRKSTPKGFKNSIEAFQDGISESLSVDIASWLYYGISLGEIEVNFHKHYGKFMNKKAKDYYEQLKKTYWRRRI